MILMNYFYYFSVRPEKPVIRILETGESVEGYLGPYQIGSSLSLVCQVNGGKYFQFFVHERIVRYIRMLIIYLLFYVTKNALKI